MSPSTSRPARPRAPQPVLALALAAVLTGGLAAPAAAIRFLNHNVLNWSGASGVARLNPMRAIARGVGPDLVAQQEVIDQAGVDLYREQVLNFREPGQWASAAFFNGPDTDNALHYRKSLFDSLTAADVVQVPTTLRIVSRYHLRLKGYPTVPGTDFYVYSFHLKSSMGSAEEAQRLSEAQVIRADAETLPVGSHILFAGDYNVYTSGEAAFQHLLSSIGQNIGRARDPINQVGNWHDNAAYAPYHTQSPRTASFGGGATGGMDDRFDFILETYNWDDGQGLELLESTYTAYGNDGLHLNQAIDGGGINAAVGAAQADSIEQASDHLPVFADLSVPARLDLPVMAHDFGTVIEGAVASFDLPIGNPAMAPADVLDYFFAPSTQFTVPVGPLTLAPGGATSHAIAMITTPPGLKSESIALTTDAPGSATPEVALLGLVLRHARPSSDSASVVVADTLDFGTEEAGGFSDRTARVWNAGFDDGQALLAVTAAAITGADGRFALVEVFEGALVGGEPAAWDVAFDDLGATAESTYTATLTFTTGDDPSFPGATARPEVVFALSARVSSPVVGVGDPVVVPERTVLFAPQPNPVTGGSAHLRFDLAHGGRVRLELFDVSGRRVATLLDEERPAGRHALGWDGTEKGRPLGNGVYFARLVASDGTTSQRRFVLMR
jgi:endonuclease/exonuclease/phosphatase family metal-dependent hydrolase